MVIPDAPPTAPLQHAPLQQRPGDSSILPPPQSPAVKWLARPRLALHGRCGPPGPLGAARAAARPSLGVKLPSLESVTSTELQPASAIAVCCPASARAGPRRINQNVDIEVQNVDIRIWFCTLISKNRRYRSFFHIGMRRYRGAKHQYRRFFNIGVRRYRSLLTTISISEASISKLHIVPDIDVINQNVDIDVS